MKVSVYVLEDGGMSVLVQASPGSGLSPALVQEVTQENFKSKVLPVVTRMRRPPRPRPVPPGTG